jgi:hypothetical protein
LCVIIKKLKTVWLGGANKQFNFHMWLSWFIKCFGLWLHRLKLNLFLLLLQSSLIFNALIDWGLKTWITSFWL